MAEYTEKDLRKAREARNLSRWKLGELLGVSESTVERWETGETKPTPEDVDRLGEALSDPLMWHKWMLSNCESYRKRYIGCEDLALLGSVVRNRYALNGVTEMQDAIERDVMDGRLDNKALGDRYAQAIRAAIAALGDTLARIGGTAK